MGTLKQDLNFKNAFACEIICNEQQSIHEAKWKMQVKNKCIHKLFFSTIMYKLLPQSEVKPQKICLKKFQGFDCHNEFSLMTCYAIKRHNKLRVSVISLLSLE